MLATRRPVTAKRRACITTIIAIARRTWAKKSKATLVSGLLAPTRPGIRLGARTQAGANDRKTRAERRVAGSGQPGRQRREFGKRERFSAPGRVHAGRCRRAAHDVERQAEPGAEGIREHFSALGERRADDRLEASRVGERNTRLAQHAQMQYGRVHLR